MRGPLGFVLTHETPQANKILHPGTSRLLFQKTYIYPTTKQVTSLNSLQPGKVALFPAKGRRPSENQEKWVAESNCRGRRRTWPLTSSIIRVEVLCFLFIAAMLKEFKLTQQLRFPLQIVTNPSWQLPINI